MIPEIVGADNRPVSAGEPGERLLVTVLFSRTLPLIRYELSDRVAASASPLESDLPFATLDRIEGRKEDVLLLGGVSVHPNVFHNALDGIAVAGWQVIETGAGVRVLLLRPEGALPDVADRVRRGLHGAGARGIPVTVEIVDEIPRTALGKAPLVRRAAATSASPSP